MSNYLLSNDNTNFFELPLGSPTHNITTETANDVTINEDWDSNFPTIKQLDFSGDGVFKGVSGINSLLEVATDTTATTAESGTEISTNLYQFQDGGEGYVFDADTLVVYDNGAEVASNNIEYIESGTGKVKFVDSYSVTGPITADFSYYTLAEAGKIENFTLSFSADEKALRNIKDCRENGGWDVRDIGLKSVSISYSGEHLKGSSEDWQEYIDNETDVYLRIKPFSTDSTYFIIRCFVSSVGQSTEAEQKITEDIELQLKNDNFKNRAVSYAIDSDSDSFPKAVELAFNNFFDKSDLYLKIEPEDDVTGKARLSGSCYVSSLEISGDVSDTLTYSVSAMNSGQITVEEIS